MSKRFTVLAAPAQLGERNEQRRDRPRADEDGYKRYTPGFHVWEVLTKPEHLKEWYMPKAWGRVSRAEMDVRPGGIFSIDIAGADGQEFPNLGCFLEVVPMERLVWTSMLFPEYRLAVFDDIPITAIMTMETVGTGTRYVFMALHRDEADLEKNKASGWLEGTEIALDQLVAHVKSMK